MQQRITTIFCIFILLMSIPVNHAEEKSNNLSVTWGSDGDLDIISPPDQWVGFSTNLTNTGTETMELYPSISGETEWGVEDSTITVEQTLIISGNSFILEVNESLSLEVQLRVPAVVNGSPLGNTPFPFQLRVSDIDGASSSWNYTVSIIAVHGLRIDNIDAITSIDPAGSIRHSITLRNTGNVFNGFGITVNPLDESGELVETDEPRRFAYDGWNATVHNFAAASALSPNETVTIELAVNAPYRDVANLSTVLSIASVQGGLEESITLSISVEVEQDYLITLDEAECSTIGPNSDCPLTVSVSNTGNFDANPGRIECWTSESWVKLYTTGTSEQNSTSFEQNAPTVLAPSTDFEIEFTAGVVNIMAAGVQATIECAYTEGNVWSSNSVMVEMKELLGWTVTGNSTEIGVSRLDYWIDVQNTGNVAEDLEAGISVSHDVQHGLVLPVDAIPLNWDSNSTLIRGFTLNDVEPGEVIRVSGWMILPNPTVESDEVWLELTLSSESDSLLEVRRTSTVVDGIGDEQSTQGDDEDISAGMVAAINTFNEYGYTAIASLIAVLLLIWAIRKRISQRVHHPENKRGADDWMGRFFKRSNKPPDLKSPEISKTEFKKMFNEKGGDKHIEQSLAVDKQIVDVASEVIDKIDEARMTNNLDTIVDDLLDDLED